MALRRRGLGSELGTVFGVLATLFGLLATLAAFAAPADAETDLGALAAVVSGSHVGSGNPDPVSGVAVGALLEATQRVGRLRVHLEGFPHVGVTASTRGAYGHSSAAISLLNATASFALDRAQRFRVGYGYQIVNLSNYNANTGATNESRVTSPRFEGVVALPVSRSGDRFFEFTLCDMPNLRGVLNAQTTAGAAEVPKPEFGAEVDYAAAYGWRAAGATWLVGFRGISYHTRNIDNGELVDRNVGAGVTFEVRVPVAR